MSNLLGKVWDWLGGLYGNTTLIAVFIASMIYGCIIEMNAQHSSLFEARCGVIEEFVESNNGTVKVVYFCPGQKSTSANYVIIEGCVTKQRRHVWTLAPCYPLPGEVWTVSRLGNSVRLEGLK